MRKNTFCIMAVLLLLAVAAAQDHAIPASPTGNDAGVEASSPVTLDARESLHPPAAPAYCSPCIFYSGDFSPKAKKLPNGLLNGVFMIDGEEADGEIWVPFSVKKQVTITGVFVNELFNTTFNSIPVIWEIRTGVAAGNPGTTVCSGSGTATAVPTGRSFEKLTELTIQIQLPEGQPCVLDGVAKDEVESRVHPPHGQCPSVCYNLGVQPQPSEADQPQQDVVGYLSDVEGTPAQHFGLADVIDDSFFFSSSFGFNYASTAPGGVCEMDSASEVSLTRVGCDMFSVGLTGTGR